MPKKEVKKYKYVAVDVNNNETKGVMLATDEENLRKILIEADLYLKSCKLASDGSQFFSMPYINRNMEIAAFARELSIMLTVGIPITEALTALMEQKQSKAMRKALIAVQNDVKSGILLSEAFAKHKRIFPELFVNMVYVGEISGMLDTILSEVADFFEHENYIKKKAQSALIYPAMLAILTAALIVVLITTIIPIFKTTLEKLNTEMPPITEFILRLSDRFTANFTYIALGAVALILIIMLLFRLEQVKYVWDMIKSKLPVVRTVTINLATSKFTRGFSALISGGVDVTKSLEIMGDLINNKYIQRKYMLALRDIKNGHTISSSFRKYKVFPEMVNQMMAVGEKSGSIGKLFKKSAAYFDGRVETSLGRLTSLLEPIIICVMGAIIAIIMLSVFSPILNIINTLGR